MSNAIPPKSTLSHQAQEIYNRMSLARDTCKSHKICIGCPILDVCASDADCYERWTDEEIEQKARRLMHDE